MARDPDAIIQEVFATSGDTGLGGLTFTEGWPLSYSQPGGQDPQRIQFNLLYRNLYALAVEINQKGPFLDYDATIDYAVNAVVQGSDGQFYVADIANGPASTVVDPVGDGTGTWVFYPRNQTRAGDFIFLPYQPTPTQLTSRRILLCDGSSVAEATYPALFAAFGGAIYGSTGAGQFNLPPLSGYFPRFWDNGAGVDPSAAGRLNRGDGTTGDNVGTTQADLVGNHGHPYIVNTDGNTTVGGAGGFVTETTSVAVQSAYSGAVSGTLGEQIGGNGGDETRGKNIYIFGGVFY